MAAMKWIKEESPRPVPLEDTVEQTPSRATPSKQLTQFLSLELVPRLMF